MTVFSDVPRRHTFHDEISWLQKTGITEGYADDTFRPSRVATRQALAVFMYRYTGAQYKATSQTFNDVPRSHPFFNEIEWAHAAGLVTGYPDVIVRNNGPDLEVTNYSPERPLTRQALAAILHRHAGAPPVNGQVLFNDVPRSHPFHDAILWLLQLRITSGYNVDEFRPSHIVTRQALAAMLHRYAGESQAPPPAPVPTPTPTPTSPPKGNFGPNQQDAFFELIGLPHGTAARRRKSTGLFQQACTWGPRLKVDNRFGDLTTAAARMVEENEGRIAPNFYLREFRCKGQDNNGRYCRNCDVINVDRRLIELAQETRDKVYRGPLVITTAYRCDGYNVRVGGMVGSAHNREPALAIDIPRRFTPDRFFDMGWRGIGKSAVDRRTVIHLDLAPWLPLNHEFQE